MLKKIRDIIKPPKDAFNPYGLKEGQLSTLKTLISRPEFKEYQALLDVLCTLLAEGLLQETDAANLHFTRGYIVGLRRAGTIVDEIVLSTEREYARDTRDADRRHRTDEQRRLAAFGSRFWGSQGGS